MPFIRLSPFGSVFAVKNLGINIDRLPLIYLISGLSMMAIGPLVGRMSDRFGKLRVFLFGGAFSIVMLFIYTNLKITPLPVLIIVNVFMFVGIFSRIIPAQALMSALPTIKNRGAFMAISSSLQQISGGFASVIAGYVVTENIDGSLQHFDRLGYIITGTTLLTMVMMSAINHRVAVKVHIETP